jgi:hypothetical protein
MKKIFTLLLLSAIYIQNINAQANAGPDQSICSNSTYMQAVNPFPNTGIWTVVSGTGTFANPTLYNTQVTDIGPWTNEYQWEVTIGSDVFQDNVNITNNEVFAVASDQSACSSTIGLIANDPSLVGGIGHWDVIAGQGNVVSPYNYITSITDVPNGTTTTLSWTVSSPDCSDYIVISVSNNKLDINAGPDQNICDDFTYMTASNPSPGTGAWSVIMGSGTFENTTNPETLISNIPHGENVYRWTVNNSGCIETSTVSITNNQPLVSAGNDTYTCQSDVLLTAIPEQAGETGTWSLIAGTGIINDIHQYNSHVTGLSPGANTFQWSVNNGLCIASDEVTIYNMQPVGINAGPDQVICSSSTILSASPPGTGETGYWDALSGSAIFDDPEAYNTSVYNLSQGTNTLRWTVTEDFCSASDLIVITNNLPTTPTTAPDDEICSSVYTLLGNPPGIGESGIWTNEYGALGMISDPTSNITTVSSIGQGSNTFRWTIFNGACSLYDEIVITNNMFTVDAGLDSHICGTSTQLQAQDPAPGTGIWSVINSSGSPIFQSPGDYNTQVTDLGYGANIFLWSVTENNCSAWDMVTIFNDSPTQANAGADQTICDGSAFLSANNPFYGTGLWTVNTGSGIISNPDQYNTMVTGLNTGINRFTWTVTEGECSSSDDVTLTYASVLVSAGPDIQVCGPFCPNLNGTIPNTGETGLWTVTGGTGIITNPTLYNTSVSGLAPGENRFTWTLSSGICSGSDEVGVFNNAPVQAVVISDKEICTDFTVIAGNSPTIGTGHWEVLAGSGVFDNSSASTTTVRLIGGGLNIYRWIITNGECSSFADIRVTNNSLESIVVDSIFVCGTTAYLSGNEPETGQIGIWSVLSGTGLLTNNSLYNTQVVNLNKGLNKFRWTLSNSTCSDYSDLAVINDLYDAYASVAGSTTICTDYADLLGNIPVSGATGTWSVWAGGGTFDNPNSPTARISGLLLGENTLRWTVTKEGCSNWDDVMITNNMVEALAGSDLVTCGNDANLVANELFPGEIGLWTKVLGPGTILTPTDNETLVTGLGAGVNVFRWSVTGNGCFDYDDVQITQNAFITSAGFDQHVCNTNVTLQGQNPIPGTGIWSFSGPAVTIVNPTLNTTVVTGLQENSPHTFRWTVTKNGCTAWDEVVIYNDLIQAHAGTDFTTCSSNIGLAAENPIAGTGIWTISAGAGTIINPTYYASGVTNLGLGSNTLVWTVTNLTCMDADIVIVTNNKVTATAGADILTCNNSVYLNGDQPIAGGYGVWVTVGGPGIIQTPSAFNTQVTNLQRGNNTFQWTVYQNGCNNGGDLVNVANNSFDAYAGEDQTLPPLTDETFFEANLNAGQTGYWSIMAGSGNITDINDPASFVYNLPNGLNAFSWNVTNSFGCHDGDQVNIYVANFTTFAGSDQIVCSNTAELNATFVPGANEQKWSIVSGAGQFDDIHNPKTVVRNILWGANIYRWTVYFPGYSAYDDVVITNDSIFVSAGVDTEICNNTFVMNAQYIQGASHFWSPIGIGGGTIVDNSAWNTLITNIPIGSNVFNWHVDNGICMSDDIVTITRKAKPIADFTVSESEFCPPQNVLMDNVSNYWPGFTPPDEFRWFVNGDFLGTTYSVGDNVNHLFTNTAQTDSTFIINMIAYDYETNCSDTATQSVLAYALPFVEFDLDPRVMEYPLATVEFENFSDADLIAYHWEFGDGYDEYQTEWVNVIEHTYAVWGTFYITLTGTSNNYCEAQFTDSVIILEANSVNDITSEFKLYPNPANNHITLSSSDNLNDAVIEIENASGQSVYYSLLNQNKKEYEFDISALANGFYILKIFSDNQIKLLKFVKK